MTFSKELQDNIYEPWRLEYVAYDDIKYDLKQRQKDHQWNENDENQFETTICLEAEKVDFFINKKQKEIDARIAYCERTLQQKGSVTSHLSDTTSKALDEIFMDLSDLSKYTRYNVLALQSLVDIHDHDTSFNARPLFVNLIRSKYLDKQRFDATLVKVSTLQDMNQPENNAGHTAVARYWVHPNNIKELRAILLFHLPVLVVNASSESEETAVSTIYLDNPDFDSYQKRLQLDDGSETIRFRWYGPMNASKNIYVEREVRHLSDITKDRLCLDANKVEGFIYGTYTADQYAEDLRTLGISENIIKTNHGIATGIQTSIIEGNLAPTLRVFYKRTAFQVPGDPRLHISLDTDLNYIREDEVSWRTDDDFPFDKVNPYRFPYAVLETRLQTGPGEEAPQWLTNLLDSSLVYQVPRFSKYLHGSAFLWHRQLPLLPWWLSQLQLNIQNKVSGNFADITKCKNLTPVIHGKHPIGYLESRLDRLSTLKHTLSLARTPSGKLNRQRDVSFISGSSLARTSSVIRPSMGNSHPMWSQENFSQDDFSPRSGSLPRQQGEYSSTDNLMSNNTPHSSYISNKKKKQEDSPKENELNTLFLEDVTDLEAGRAFNGEKKKKKKKEAKDPKEVGATVEPKVFFASERTFIRWLHFACTLMSCAITLLNFGDTINRIVAIVFFGICFIFVLYSFGFFRWRANRIRYKPHLRYDDWFGPPMLCVLLIGALILNFVLRWRSPAQNNTYLGTGNTTNTADTSVI